MEKKKFWNLYEEYQLELNKLNRKSMNMIQEYAEYYKYMTDQKAESLIDEFFEIREKKLKIRKSYVDQFKKVISTKNVFRFYQVENKMEAISRHNMAREIPLVR